MSREEMKSKIAELEAALAEQTNKAAELEAKLAAQPVAVAAVGKGRQQAAAALALLEKGTVTLAELAGINSKYPSDPIYYVRTLLKVDVKTSRAKGGKTTYSLVKPAVVEAAAAPTTEAPAELVAEAATEPVAEVAAQ